ncbi:MAG: glycosyltransferase family 39 protein [Leptolyngbya sp. SIO1D8]|nr:glycosyltransferase family 39 protein [Leptolyngbya sp. SIO1D8]
MNLLKPKLVSIKKDVPVKQTLTFSISLSILFGIFLRIHQYLYNRQLWLDEAMLSTSIINRSFGGLLQPLEARQNAPIPFLFLTRLSVEIFGSNEYALRLPALIFGLLSLGLFYVVSKKYISADAVPISVFLFAISNALIYYSSELKQYSGDVLSVLICLLMVERIHDHRLNTLQAIAWGGLGAILIWFSLPVVFVLASGGICLLLFERKTKIHTLFITFSIWLLSFLSLFYLFINRSLANEGLKNSWTAKDYFAPIPFLSPLNETLRWYLTTFQNIFVSPGGFASYELAGVLFLAGCWLLLKKRHKYRLLVLLLPIVFALLASMLKQYIFTTRVEYVQGGRLVLFLLPAILLLVSEGLEYFKLRTHKIIFIWMLILLLLHPLKISLIHVKNPRIGENVKPVIEYVFDNSEEPDKIYLHPRIKHQFWYYKNLLREQINLDVLEGVRDRDGFVHDIRGLDNHPRIWFLFSYTLNDDKLEKDSFLSQVNRRGCQLDAIEVEGASAYLYDLSQTQCSISRHS